MLRLDYKSFVRHGPSCELYRYTEWVHDHEMNYNDLQFMYDTMLATL